MAGIEDHPIDSNAIHPFALPGTNSISRVDSPSWIIRKPCEHLDFMASVTQGYRQRESFEYRFRLEPLTEKEDLQFLCQTSRLI